MPGELTSFAVSLGKNLAAVNAEAGRAISRVAVDVVNDEASDLWGSDRKFSGSARSKKGRRPAKAYARVNGDSVDVYPSGDPWQITLRGRPGRIIRPRARTRGRPKKGAPRRALRLPDGSFRSQVQTKKMAGRPEVLNRPTRKIADRAAEEISRAVDAAIRKAL